MLRSQTNTLRGRETARELVLISFGSHVREKGEREGERQREWEVRRKGERMRRDAERMKVLQSHREMSIERDMERWTYVKREKVMHKKEEREGTRECVRDGLWKREKEKERETERQRDRVTSLLVALEWRADGILLCGVVLMSFGKSGTQTNLCFFFTNN